MLNLAVKSVYKIDLIRQRNKIFKLKEKVKQLDNRYLVIQTDKYTLFDMCIIEANSDEEAPNAVAKVLEKSLTQYMKVINDQLHDRQLKTPLDLVQWLIEEKELKIVRLNRLTKEQLSLNRGDITFEKIQ